jgi:hypothetical protein
VDLSRQIQDPQDHLGRHQQFQVLPAQLDHLDHLDHLDQADQAVLNLPFLDPQAQLVHLDFEDRVDQADHRDQVGQLARRQ